ncbi:MAG: isochorismatase family protein [Candidatus Hydrogenedens sp.]|nr:isochorismatase family protein [Candidatus Hydrogenedens sp.]
MEIRSTDALIAVDVQNDFCPGGALPVPFGDTIVSKVNSLVIKFETLVFSRDWHPNNHCSFSDTPLFEDMSWPMHCVQDSPGAEFHGDLFVPGDGRVISKGTDPEREAYSAFEGTDLDAWLRERGVERVFVAGLAFDYCVRATAVDAARAGYETWVVEDACAGISEVTMERAREELTAAGVQFCGTSDFT